MKTIELLTLSDKMRTIDSVAGRILNQAKDLPKLVYGDYVKLKVYSGLWDSANSEYDEEDISTGVVSWAAAIDADLNLTTDPCWRGTSGAGDVSYKDDDGHYAEIIAELDTSTFADATEGSEEVLGYVEVRGYDSNARQIAYARGQVCLSCAVDAGGAAPSPESDYYNKAQVDALFTNLDQPDAYEFTVDDGNTYEQAVFDSAAYSSARVRVVAITPEGRVRTWSTDAVWDQGAVANGGGGGGYGAPGGVGISISDDGAGVVTVVVGWTAVDSTDPLDVKIWVYDKF